MIYVGTSGWAYTAWKPDFYPEKLAQKKFLQHYATRLNGVEVNYSFRHIIAEKTLNNWIAETPAGFAFCIKAHQGITHIRRLKNTDEILARFLSSIEPLAAAGKLGAVLFQLPPNMKADAALLDAFLALLPRTLRPAFEFRHQSWFSDEVFAALRSHNAALCLAESDELAAPEVFTADFAYYRFRRTEYSAGERRAMASRLRQAAATHSVFAFLKHEERPESALWAEEVLHLAAPTAAA
ncbi:MAG: DUF72 domain-containing protein [Terriglobales bacterium]